MAVVSIDIDAMQALVQALEAAERDGPPVGDDLARILNQEWLSVPQMGEWVSTGPAWVWLHTLLADCRQRLGLAQMIASTEPSLPRVVVCDDTYAGEFPEDFHWLAPDQAMVDTLTQELLGAGGDLTEEQALADATRIATMIANADEPYRSLYTQHIDHLVFDDLPSGRGGYYTFWDNHIHIDVDALMNNQPVPFREFFHEFAHGIDDWQTAVGSTTTWFTYTTSAGTAGRLADFLSGDVRTQLGTQVMAYTPDSAQGERVVNAIMGSNIYYLNGWPPDYYATWPRRPTTAAAGSDAAVYVLLRDYYTNPTPHAGQDLGVFLNSGSQTASDVFGAETNRQIQGTWGHYQEYYWAFPDVSGAPAKEFWANYAADNMVYYSELAERAAPGVVPGGDGASWSSLGMTSRDVTQRLFPDATSAADAMAQQMVTS